MTSPLRLRMSNSAATRVPAPPTAPPAAPATPGADAGADIDAMDVATPADTGWVSLGASYTHVDTLAGGGVGSRTRRVVAYHAFLTSLDGFEAATSGVDDAFLGFNRIAAFRPADAALPRFGVLDLAGNPLTSLQHCPPCDTLIVSGCRLRDLTGAPAGTRVLRCGHSSTLESLRGCPASVQILECSCAPALRVDLADLPVTLRELLMDDARVCGAWHAARQSP